MMIRYDVIASCFQSTYANVQLLRITIISENHREVEKHKA